jgi:electron transfer flavoprotein alpha subunit
MKRALVLADRHAIAAATELCDAIDVLVCGDKARADEMACVAGVQAVYYTDDPLYAQGLAENTAALIQSLSKNYDLIIGSANAWGKNILPRLSGLLHWPMLADVIAIQDKQTFVRPIYAGNALQTIRMRADKFILSVRSANFDPCLETQPPAPVTKLTERCDTQKARFIEQHLHETDRPDLANAQIIIAGGRGLQEKANFALLEKIADLLHGAVGASRAAVDAGWVPNDYQIGQTGKIVAPQLYIAVGISGAIQHLAGMKDSKVIVAINKDPEAPIFAVADYGLVADLFEALPLLEQALHEH